MAHVRKVLRFLKKKLLFIVIIFLMLSTFVGLVYIDKWDKKIEKEAAEVKAKDAEFTATLAKYKELKGKIEDAKKQNVETKSLNDEMTRVKAYIFTKKSYPGAKKLINTTNNKLNALVKIALEEQKRKEEEEKQKALEAEQERIAVQKKSEEEVPPPAEEVAPPQEEPQQATQEDELAELNQINPCSGNEPVNELACLILTYREYNNLSYLYKNTALMRAAQQYADWMNANQTLPADHTGEGGSTFNERCEAEGQTCRAEIIAQTTCPFCAFLLWRSSPGHNAQMINPTYIRMGIGISGSYYAVDFY